MIEACFFADELSGDFGEVVRLGAKASARAVELRGGSGAIVEELLP